MMEPVWQNHFMGMVMPIAGAKQVQECTQAEAIRQIQQNAIDAINLLAQNRLRDARLSVADPSPGIRELETFRDPATGKTYELSNQYGHAWLNGNDEYVLSDNPHFDPNTVLTGCWTALQLVSSAA